MKEVLYKRYKIVLAIALIAIILLPITNGSLLLYETKKYNTLDNKYDQLDEKHKNLQSQHNNLQNEHNSLETDYNSLNNKHNNLKSNYNTLQSNYNSLQYNYDTLQEQYEGYTESIEFRYGDGEDCMQFITPTNFNVKSKTQNILGHYSDGDISWDDMRDIFDWVVDNIEYNYDTFIGERRNCYLFPEETLDLRYGDCEDQSVLLISLCKAEEDASWIYCAGVNYYKPGEGTVAHIFVIVNVADDKMYIFDPTHRTEPFWGNEEGWQSSSSKSEYEAILEYKNYWGYSNLRIKKIFNDNVYYTFDSNQDFFDFF